MGIRDETLPLGCDIDHSDQSCSKISSCEGLNQECSGVVYGVCQCKPGFCKDANGDCAATAAFLEALTITDLASNQTGADKLQHHADGKQERMDQSTMEAGKAFAA